MTTDAEPQRLLIIDDSPMIHDLVTAHLASMGVTVLSAPTGARGLRLARRQRPDLILLDVDLGDTTGFEVCKRLKAHRATAAIPIIFLTGADDMTAKVRAFDLGAVDYVTKPFHACELIARVRSALETRRLIRELDARAHTDMLTGLPNRRSFMQALGRCVARCQRSHIAHYAVIFIDLDGFKAVNDTFGHDVGDELLVQVASALRSGLRTSHARHPGTERDVVARLGGDEFLVLLDNVNAAKDAMAVAEQLRQLVSRPRAIDGHDVRVGASVGVRMADPAASAAQLLSESDAAMYHAKTHGKGHCFLLGTTPPRALPLTA